VVRADEEGTGQSPGMLNPSSARTIDAFCEVIEWCSEQSWSTGKVGLLGISYFAATQWRAAARNPKGLAAAVPWEGFSDIYRDSQRHGGILSSGFPRVWWPFQVASNQYGLPGRAARNWGPDTIEGDLPEEELLENTVDILSRGRLNRYRDDIAAKESEFNLEDITVPILSVANWGGILLHLRGNVEGYTWASSEFKYLRFISGRHDLPFYYEEEVEIQRSFLDAFLKDDDRRGWSKKGVLPPVDMVVRKGDIGFNNPTTEKALSRRYEMGWPIARTVYTKLFLAPNGEMLFNQPNISIASKQSYEAPGTGRPSDMLTFKTRPFEKETEITGHIVARLNVSASQRDGSIPSDLDLFVSLRHISSKGTEILYTGTTGEGAPVTKGFLRVSMRKTNPNHPRHRSWLPYREYLSTDVLPVFANEVYTVDVELWPTNVVVDAGNRLALEISSGDTAGTGLFTHDDPVDR
jgi:predicted acyl esterase